MNIQTIQTSEGLAMAMVRQQIAKAEELADGMAQQFWPMIGTANQTAYMAMDDAIDAMRDCGMLRQKVKVKAMRALAEYEKYDRAAYEHFHETGDDRYRLWQDLIARGADRLQPDVQKLYFSVKNVIDRAGCRNSVALAKIQTALALVTLSTLMYDTMAAQFQRQTMIPIRQTCAGGRLTAVESLWREVGWLTGRQVLQDVDLRDDPQCMLGVQVILTRYQAADFLNEAAGEALALNPECEKYVND